jgi:hypothetical protein
MLNERVLPARVLLCSLPPPLCRSLVDNGRDKTECARVKPPRTNGSHRHACLPRLRFAPIAAAVHVFCGCTSECRAAADGTRSSPPVFGNDCLCWVVDQQSRRHGIATACGRKQGEISPLAGGHSSAGDLLLLPAASSMHNKQQHASSIEFRGCSSGAPARLPASLCLLCGRMGHTHALPKNHLTFLAAHTRAFHALDSQRLFLQQSTPTSGPEREAQHKRRRAV